MPAPPAPVYGRAVDPPATRYLDRRGKQLAYQSFGDGASAVVLFQEVISHLDLQWTDPTWVQQCRRLAAYARVVVFQQVGVGLSDTIDRVPTLEEQASDIGAVMDAEKIGSATLSGVYSTAMPILLFAAQSPTRVDSLVLYSPIAQGLRHAGPEQTMGFTPAEGHAALAAWDDAFDHWGEGRTMDVWDPVIADRVRPMAAMLERTSATPSVAAAVYRAAATSNVRDLLPLVRAPTRVLYHRSFSFPERSVRIVAEELPHATFHELPPSAPYMSMVEAAMPVFDHLVEAVCGDAPGRRDERELATLLFTDVVASTELVARYGDAQWSDLIRRHEHQIRFEVQQSGGELVKMLGDGSLSVLPGPAAAIRCARTIIEQAQSLQLEVRAGVHTGECERRAGDVIGIAVHIAARVSAMAGPGEIWVTRTVRDIIGGSGLALRSRGEHRLKGVPEPWELFELRAHEENVTVGTESRTLRPVDRLAITAARRVPRIVQAVNRLDCAWHRRRAGEA
jgi:class 3 adenylate cyclase/pimeloyl-ACP methyl ester carboxylesterase